MFIDFWDRPFIPWGKEAPVLPILIQCSTINDANTIYTPVQDLLSSIIRSVGFDAGEDIATAIYRSPLSILNKERAFYPVFSGGDARCIFQNYK